MIQKPETTWEGFRFPARLLTKEESEILSPRCNRCGLPACITELQQPLTKELARTPLVSIANEVLQFYCAHHSPIEVSDALTQRTDCDFYMTVRVLVVCPKQDFRRYANNCLAIQPNCLKRCTPIRNLVNSLSLKEAGKITKAEHIIEQCEKERKKHEQSES